jgi:hypothetical protein
MVPVGLGSMVDERTAVRAPALSLRQFRRQNAGRWRRYRTSDFVRYWGSDCMSVVA